MANDFKSPLQCQTDADGRERATHDGKRDREGGGGGGGGVRRGGREDDEDEDDVDVDHDGNLQKALSQIHTPTYTHIYSYR